MSHEAPRTGGFAAEVAADMQVGYVAVCGKRCFELGTNGIGTTIRSVLVEAQLFGLLTLTRSPYLLISYASVFKRGAAAIWKRFKNKNDFGLSIPQYSGLKDLGPTHHLQEGRNVSTLEKNSDDAHLSRCTSG